MQVLGTKALRWVLLWILQLVPCVGNEIRWKMMDTCERGWRGGQHCQKKKVKTAREGTQRPFKKPASRGTLEPQKETARERTQALSEAETIRRKGGEFRKSGRKRSGGREKKKKKKKKKVKYRKRKWWKKRKEIIISLSVMRMKKGRRGKGKQKKSKTSPKRDEPLGNLGFGSFSS